MDNNQILVPDPQRQVSIKNHPGYNIALMNLHQHTIKASQKNRVAKRYPWILAAFSIPFFCFTLIEALRSKNRKYFKQRLGISTGCDLNRPLWIHAASVGEVLAVKPLVLEIIKQYPDIEILLTTTTPTGATTASNNLGSEVHHQFLPIDWEFSINRFLRAHKPRAALIMETEIWPNLFASCARLQIPLYMINARLSEKTLVSKKWVLPALRIAVNNCTKILARSGHDSDLFLRLGADADRVVNFGNIKFAAVARNLEPPAELATDRPYVLAASTHDTEEILLARVWKALDQNRNLLVIAPRHPTRLNQILQQLEPLGLELAIRSRGQSIKDTTQIFLLDTLGEMINFIPDSRFVFMGGSFISPGGHNFLEPAHFGKAIIFGPNMQLVATEAETFLEKNAVLQVDSEVALKSRFLQLLNDTDFCTELGNRARAIIEDNADITHRYLKVLTHALVPDKNN